ncbi:hypothetical protein CLOM_g16753 [Closterium sp. NIES-68]|nr:hypothetical protein CLOM_g16753 [Closterium sp. NIES-68]GJP71980.1 hypothetical protein CLOP_g2759 [Closterium sp. NIES-67]GJP73218.1 hypothetical protein CLOP_g3957 [Closterium sp. NIES-67]
MSYSGESNPSPYDYPLPGGPAPRGDVVVTGLTGGYGSEKKGKGHHYGHGKHGHHGKHGQHGHHGGHGKHGGHYSHHGNKTKSGHYGRKHK